MDLQNIIKAVSDRIQSDQQFLADLIQLKTEPEAQLDALSAWQSLEEFQKTYPEKFSDSQLRGLLNDRACNGLDKHVRKVGKRLYIYVPGFAIWLKTGCADAKSVGSP